MEMTKAFEIITAKVEKILSEKGYEKHNVSGSDKEMSVLFTGDIAYSILYNGDNNRVMLRSCGMSGDEPDNSWKILATWLFDPQSDTVSDAENIGSDFAETITGPKQIKQQNRKKGKKDGENTSDPLFFANRLIAYFPELRDDIAYEKAHYAEFRGITFADEKIMPLFRDYVVSSSPKMLEKLSKTMSDLYEAGDLDVKGIITYILFNSIEDDKKFEILIDEFDKDNKAVAREARKLRGKKIKPEKPKKQNKFIADTLNAQ